ncbi:MAG: ABC transporter ATP-binding protein [Methylocystis sp.]
MKPILAAESICAAYDRAQVLHDISLTVQAGQIVTVLGPNGAGKTTLLNSLMGLLPSQGRVIFSDSAFLDTPPERRLEAGLCLVPERRELFTTMPVEDNLALGAYIRYRRHDRAIAETLDEVYQIFPRLKERRKQIAGTLSGGERQMLALGRALMSKPSLMMLDEPSLGLAPKVCEEIFSIITRLRDSGVSVLLVEQNARASLRIADYAYVLETGRCVLQGSAKELAENEQVHASYLGGSSQH